MTGLEGEAALCLGGPWTEASFDRGEYGTAGESGVETVFEADGMRLRVLPVRYEAGDGQERISSHTSDLEMRWRDPTRFVPDVPRQTVFAVLADYQPIGDSQRAVFSVLSDCWDAVTVAVWVANGSPDPAALHRNIRLHRGDPVSRTQVTVSDDDALTALFVDSPERCLFTKNPTGSHTISFPYRFAPLLTGFRYTDRGVPRVPSTIDCLQARVSHSAWTDRSLEAIDWATPLEREGPGEYKMDDQVATALNEGHASVASMVRIGDR